ncbi:MAG: hypothetical protein LVQ95_02480 [Candidatus Micrarchaeales archaeon]|nr:hypothetical protein [Candidatus Micrarchaeales archaeon]
MIPIVGDWFEALRETFMPKTATGSWSVGGALGKYYKRMIVPLILAFIIQIWLIASGPTASLLPTFTGSLLGITLAGLLISFLVTIPISILIVAIVYNIFGEMVGAITKGDFGDTVSATMHSFMPYVSLYFVWQILFSLVTGTLVSAPYIILTILLVLFIWEIIVFVFSFAAVHKTTKGRAFLTWLVPFIIAVIAFIALVVLFASIYNIASGILPLVLGGGTGAVP